jgi:probable rRNA maturation factor
MATVNFHTEEIPFTLKQKIAVRKWVKNAAAEEGFKIQELNYIFCSDPYLLAINQQYLQHDTYTDIVTFDNSDGSGPLLGDIFISVDRVRENAGIFGVTEQDELHRVMIHGVLHLCGYDDHTASDKKKMRDREDYYLAKRGGI